MTTVVVMMMVVMVAGPNTGPWRLRDPGFLFKLLGPAYMQRPGVGARSLLAGVSKLMDDCF